MTTQTAQALEESVKGLAFFAGRRGGCVRQARFEFTSTPVRLNSLASARLDKQVVSAFLTATFFASEAKGRMLEKIEQRFEGRK